MEKIPFASAAGGERTLCVWLPEGEPKYVVQLVHGMVEHIGRYERLAAFLNARGIAAAGFDLPGHGAGTPQENLGFFSEKDGWLKVLSDVRHANRLLRSRFPGLPVVLFGHSMGSFIVRAYMLQFSDYPDALAVCGSQQPTKLLTGAGLFLAALVCLTGGKKKQCPLIERMAFSANNKPFLPARTPFDWLSRDEKEVDAYIADPYCGFPFTAGAYRDLFRLMMSLTRPKNLNKLPKALPVYIIGGEKDPVGALGRGVPAIAKEYEAFGLRDVTMKIYPGARHELLNETNRAEVMEDLVSWMDARVKGKTP